MVKFSRPLRRAKRLAWRSDDTTTKAACCAASPPHNRRIVGRTIPVEIQNAGHHRRGMRQTTRSNALASADINAKDGGAVETGGACGMRRHG